MRLAFLAIFLFAAPALAQETRPSQAACERAKLPGRAYIECLETAARAADKALNDAQARARATIDARPDLAAVQKNRWKNALEEAQNAFIAFRNVECQNVAPYEGARGIGAFEERLACLVDKATARARELDSRYGKR
ncbi:MAG TPA: lysozyme inhibitor LprI family protein [Xanthobacteraceae bacterium]|jgi:uncharacterized protein YecT (DUF1311 family)